MNTITKGLIQSRHAYRKWHKIIPTIVYMSGDTIKLLNEQLLNGMTLSYNRSIKASPRPDLVPLPVHKDIKFGDYICGMKILPALDDSKDLELE